jgi:phenylpropionate dioxygenase-like ring-hydroxylating dioxygenase large terminal subunit
LTAGKFVFPGTVSCRYHGWTYELASGKLVGALTDGPDSPLVGKVCLKSYPVAERRGIVWVFIGDGAAHPLEEDVPEEFLAEDRVVQSRVRVRQGNWRLAAENGLDPAHAAFLHRDALLTFFRRLPAHKGKITPEIDGPWVGYSQNPVLVADYPGLGRWPANQWWKRPRKTDRKGKPTKVQLRLPGFLRVDPFPGPGMVHFEWYVPVDETSHRYFQFAIKKASGIKAVWFKFTYQLWWKWLAHVLFNNQDAWMVESMEPFYTRMGGWEKEKLFRPDAGLTAWRIFASENGRAVQGIPQATSKEKTDDRSVVEERRAI